MRINDKKSMHSASFSIRNRIFRQQNNTLNVADGQSIGSRENLWVKRQVRKGDDDNSDFVSQFDGEHVQVIKDDQSDMSSQVQRVSGAISFNSRSIRSRQTRKSMSKIMNQSMRSGQSGKDSQGIRKQFIDDCDSYDSE